MVYLSYFHSSLQDQHPIYPENHMKKGLLFLQETGYKNANGSQLLNKLILAK